MSSISALMKQCALAGADSDANSMNLYLFNLLSAECLHASRHPVDRSNEADELRKRLKLFPQMLPITHE